MFRENGALSNETNKENLLRLSLDECVSAEKRVVELYEYAYLLAEAAYALSVDGLGIYEIIGALLEPETAAVEYGGVLAQNRERVMHYLNASSALDRAYFVKFFVAALSELGLVLSEESFLPSGNGDESFTYVKNRLADEAYDVLSEEFSDPRVFYAADLREAARAVRDGKVAHCLLPLEEKGGARIGVVSDLLYSFDLKINSVTPVFGFDGNADMKYARVSRHFTIPEIGEDDDRYLEIRLPYSDISQLSSLLAAASTLGISLYRINSTAFENAEGKSQLLSAVFSTTKGSFATFLTYLSVFMPLYTAVGIYKNLE